MNFLMLATGAVLGASSRYYLGLWIASRLGTGFPYGTFLINVTGSLVLGFFGTLALDRAAVIPTELRLLVAVGFAGSYTTFSTYTFETLRLLEDGDFLLALLYALGSVLAGLLSVYLGVVIARALP